MNKRKRMHSSRMHTARSSSHHRGGGVGLDQIPLNFPLGVGLETCKACWDQTPSRTRLPWHQASLRTSAPRTRHPPGPGTPQNQAPPGTRHPPDQPHPPVNRITDTCKNITLTQTSFAGGKNVHMNLNQFTCDLTCPSSIHLH